MRIVDANLLLYAVDRGSDRHAVSRAFLERILQDEETIGIPWTVALAFLRIGTNPRAFPRALSSAEATAFLDGWLVRKNVVFLSPGNGHWRILSELTSAVGAKGNLIMDTYLAALAIENGAELCSADTDFSRFPRLRWTDPFRPAA